MALIKRPMIPLSEATPLTSWQVHVDGSPVRDRETSRPSTARHPPTPFGSSAGARWLLALLLACAVLPAQASSQEPWQRLEDGLDLGIFTAPLPSDGGDSKIRVLRIDPTRFELRLLNASVSKDGRPQTPREWSRRHGLVAAINASMYQADYRSSISLMRTREHTNNSRLSKDKAVLAFDPVDPSVPPVQIIDRSCQDFTGLRSRYGTLVQSIRMVSCTRRNVWTQGPDKWSTAAIGMDAKGRVLFIHVRSPYSTHDLIDLLLALPIDLRNAMYVEGGPQAQLYVSSGGHELELTGSHAATLLLGEAAVPALPIPNVVGLVRRSGVSSTDLGN